MDKLQKLSFPIAVILIIGALGIKVGRPEWKLYVNILLGAGGFFFLLSLYFERHSLKSFFSARSTRYGLNSAAMVLLALAIVALVNWIAARHTWKYDTTKDKAFSLSSLTVNALKELKQPVKVTAFYTYEDEASRSKIKTLLEDYQQHTKQLDVKMVDPLKNLNLVRQYDVTRNGTTVIESGTQKTTVTSTNEEDITNAILKVSSNKQTTVYFMQGHDEASTSTFDEHGLSAVAEALRKANYNVKDLAEFAAKGKVPEDCDLLVLPGPGVSYLDHEIQGILDYLNQGGRAIILDDPRADPSLGKIINPFGIRAADHIVVDDNCFFPLAGPIMPCGVPQLGHAVTKEFDDRALLFFPDTRNLTYNQEANGKETYTKIVESSPTSWGETDKEQASFEEGKDEKGPLTLGLLVTKKVEGEQKKTDETRLAVFGDLNFVQNQFVNLSPWNYQLFSNTVAWLTEQENLIHLPPKESKGDVMFLSNTQIGYIWFLVIVIMPLAVIGTGITVWMRRKKL